MRHFSIIILMLLYMRAVPQAPVSIIAPQSLLSHSISAISIADVQQLLGQACGCTVSLNDHHAHIQILLPEIDQKEAEALNHFARQATFPYRNFPEHNYTWTIRTESDRVIYELNTVSWQGVSFGLYGLLQEHLGFRFYHPRQTVIPDLRAGWPIERAGTFSGIPLFDKKGFHLHTQHPIELTEQLLDPAAPHAIEDVKQYIDWLVRNGQNYFEFCLLNDVDPKLWPPHARAFVDYAHSRGILIGVDLSLHMIQQKSYQLYKGSINQKKQIEKSLTWLAQEDWDFFNMEFSKAEFMAGNKKRKEELRQYILTWLMTHTHTKLMGRQHIVKHTEELGHKHKEFVWDSTSLALDKQRGVMPHTVMFYDMTEPNAPVYQNKNQRHQFEFMIAQSRERETWYHPESAYWVTFDNSIPMFLLPYLSARLTDIDTCVKYGVPGHVTFSSGWEWGYWLFDWSIARWSWRYSYDGKDEVRTPTMYAYQMSMGANANLLGRAMDWQQAYLKDSTLMQWMTAMTITDEIGIKALSTEYEPRPQWSYKYLERKAPDSIINIVRQTILPQLSNFGKASYHIAMEFLSHTEINKHRLNTIGQDTTKTDEAWNEMKDSISQEWMDGIAITGLRAQHRYYTLRYILDRREAALHHHHFEGDSLLKRATAIRAEAQQIVNRRQLHYRYPLASIAAQRWDHTAYHFGYLYLASDLHLWHREEEEARKNKYSPFFMNVWNVGRIAGFIK